MIKQITGKCRECGKEIQTQYEHDPESPVPIEMLDKMIGWLTCYDCLVKLRRVRHTEPKPFVPKVVQTGLPYRDE